MNNLLIYRLTVIILLLANIAVTIYFSNKPLSNNLIPTSSEMEKSVITSDTHFPEGLGETNITQIFFSISEAYNKQSYEELLSLLDPAIVEKFGRKSMLKELEKLYDLFGPIIEGFFSSVHPIGTTDKKTYKINYDIRLSETSKVGREAILSVTVQLESSGYKIKGIFLNTPPDYKE